MDDKHNTRHLAKVLWAPAFLQKVVDESVCLADAIRALGYAPIGNNYRAVKALLQRENIPFDHLLNLQDVRRFGRGGLEALPLAQILVEHSTYSRKDLKRRLLKEKLLTEKCAICEGGPVWNNKPLTLRLDHVNGVRDDHRLANLRLLCPNCDSQTVTYCGRNIKQRERPKGVCRICGSFTQSTLNTMCQSCTYATRRRFTISREELRRLLLGLSGKEVGRRFGVSGELVLRRARQLGIHSPKRKLGSGEVGNAPDFRL